MLIATIIPLGQLYSNSLTWNVGPFWDDSPKILTMIPGFGRTGLGRDEIYPDKSHESIHHPSSPGQCSLFSLNIPIIKLADITSLHFAQLSVQLRQEARQTWGDTGKAMGQVKLVQWCPRYSIAMYPYAPWCWYIYLQNWAIYGVHVGYCFPAPWTIWGIA